MINEDVGPCVGAQCDALHTEMFSILQKLQKIYIVRLYYVFYKLPRILP